MDYVIVKQYSISQSISMGGVYAPLPLMFVSVIWCALTSEWAECTFLPLDFGLGLWLPWANGMLGRASGSALALLLLCYCKLKLFGFLGSGAQSLLCPSISLVAIFQVERSSLIENWWLCARALDIVSVTSIRVWQNFHRELLLLTVLLVPEIYGPRGRTAHTEWKPF